MCCVVVCDLETSRMGAPYIYDISHLRVKLFWLKSCSSGWVLVYLFILQLIYSFLFIYLRLKSSHSGALVNIELEWMKAKVLQAQCELLPRYFPKGAEENCNCWWVSRVPSLNFDPEQPIYEPAEINTRFDGRLL